MIDFYIYKFVYYLILAQVGQIKLRLETFREVRQTIAFCLLLFRSEIWITAKGRIFL